MIGTPSFFIVAGTLILVGTIVYVLIMIRKNWDVLVKNRTFLVTQISIEICLLLLMLAAFFSIYTSGSWDIRTELAIFISSLLVLYEAILGFTKVHNVKDRTMEVMEALICVMEAGDPNLDGHSVHVHNIVNVFYDYLPAAYQHRLNLEDLKYASLFLDLGKLGIPRSILMKPGKLTREEMELVRRHPEISTKILEPVGQFSRISDWILYHHERVDGKGYRELKGEEIPLASRIIAIADTYSALTMDRTYKASLPYEEAIIELRQAAGTQLDAELVGYFCEIPRHRLDECLESVRRIMERYQDEHFGE